MKVHECWKYTSVLLKLIGIWPESKKINKMHMGSILVTLTNAAVNSCYCSAVEFPNLSNMIIPLTQGAIAVLALSKYVVFLFNYENLRWQMKVLRTTFWASITPKTTRASILQDLAKKTLLQTKLVAFCIYTSGCLSISRPIVKMHLDSYRQRLLLQKNWFYMLNSLETPIYQLTYFFQVLSAFIVLTAQISINNSFIVLCSGLNAQFELLKHQFKNLGRHIKHEQLYQYNNHKRLLEEVKVYIKYHGLLLRYARMIEQSYSISILTLFLLSSVFLCLSAFHFISNPSDFWDTITNLMFLFTMIQEVYLYCSNAQQLRTLSSEISDAIFGSGWIYFPKDVKILLYFVMMRCVKPAALTMGKFRVISLETFRSILSTSASYTTLLESINDK